MTSALALPTSATALAPRVVRAPVVSAAPQTQYVFGDSTPFPPDVDFITVIRRTVTCGVALMRAQHAVDAARLHVRAAQEELSYVHAELASMRGAVEKALASARPRKGQARDAAARIGSLVDATVASELQRIRSALDRTLVQSDGAILEARKTAAAAVGELLSATALPDAAVALRVYASGPSYAAEATVTLPCALSAVFQVRIPAGHPWATLRRLSDATAGVVVTLPQEVGWLKKRSEPVPVSLDGLTVLGMSSDGPRGALLLGKNERSGICHAFDVELDRSNARVDWRDGDERAGTALASSDAAKVARLLRVMERETADLRAHRGALTEATVDGEPLVQCDPAEVCKRLVALIAPATREIARRSGAPGELVLRRNLGSGHRDEVFVTQAELREPIETLPPALRLVFAPLELAGAPRSPRAPARSMPTYEEISACEFLPAG